MDYLIFAFSCAFIIASLVIEIFNNRYFVLGLSRFIGQRDTRKITKKLIIIKWKIQNKYINPSNTSCMQIFRLDMMPQFRRFSNAFQHGFHFSLETLLELSHAYIVVCLDCKQNHISLQKRESRFLTIYFFSESSNSYHNFRVILRLETGQNTTEIFIPYDKENPIILPEFCIFCRFLRKKMIEIDES